MSAANRTVSIILTLREASGGLFLGSNLGGHVQSTERIKLAKQHGSAQNPTSMTKGQQQARVSSNERNWGNPLADHNSLPIPVTQFCRGSGATIIDQLASQHTSMSCTAESTYPIGHEASNAEVHLPETHDLSSCVGRGKFADVDWACGKCNSLPN